MTKSILKTANNVESKTSVRIDISQKSFKEIFDILKELYDLKRRGKIKIRRKF